MSQPSEEVLLLLGELELTRDLSEEQRHQLAEQCIFAELPEHQRIRPSAETKERFFLVDGHVVQLINGVGERFQGLRGLGEPTELLEECSSTDDASFVTETPCILLRIPSAALDALINEGVDVDDVELDATEGEFLSELYPLITEKKLELPARPEVALKVQQLTNDPDSGIQELTEVIQSDGTIAGALLHATNSPLFRGTQEIQSVRDAVLRMGFRNTRMLTTNLALRQVFKARHESTRSAMTVVWSDGVLRSAYSYVLADTLGILNRDRALLAGLIAQIGAVPIIQFIERKTPDPSPDLIGSLVAKLGSITGVLVINYWGLGEDLVRVGEHSHDWNYRAEEPDYVSIVIVAQWAALQSEGRDHPDASTVPAFEVLGLTPPPVGEPIAELAASGGALETLKKLFTG